jgi:hypothetical protein
MDRDPPRQVDRGGDQLGDDEGGDGSRVPDREIDLGQQQREDLGDPEQDVLGRLHEQIDEVRRSQKR